ncbi:Glycosyltransferase family 9 protein [Rhodovastum atsumiense]|uniref:Glycosyltransferase family 9 protein n=1 Tax=Rhodovastum atsumiense TaxID=504468 RepID=A0A5M6IQV1_9PROT|nr:glycosyltransferase family 9 protein [Rhodovastum atsumiense]KAA5610670.1 glycosyltransferase family 9 protein [Rhodovastum atsumiense]CAH2603336.1 Glycosyltransferase family 9 protein [Rhodovastum atsumiense]
MEQAPLVRDVSLTTLTRRLRRFSATLRETYARDGLRATTTLLARQLRRKGPMLGRHLLGAGRLRLVRARIGRQRAGFPPSRIHCAVAVTGGLGDCLVIARFLRDLAASCGDIAFDVFSPTPELAGWAFAAVPGFNQAYDDILFERLLGEYDLALRANQTVVVYRECVRWETLREAPALVRALRTLIHARAGVDVFINQHPYLDNFLGQRAVFAGATRRDWLHRMAGIAYGGDRLAVPANRLAPARLGLPAGGYVTVHNGFDTRFVISGRRATKCYPQFGAVVARLKQALPHLLFVQLGARDTSEPLAECDLDLVGRTTLQDAAGVLAQAAFHIDNEGGLVHLARCYGVTSGVVFGPTPSDYFAYPDNVSLDPPVCGNCWWLTRDWMDACAKGHKEPRCMTEQHPTDVAERLLAAMLAHGLGTALPPPDAVAALPCTPGEDA